jgi:hypothetical protein
MRRWFVLVLVLLLPLRGWAGEFMSVQMIADGAGAHVSAMPPDCPMHAGEFAPLATTLPADECCASCELCIPMAELASVRLDAVAYARHEMPRAFGAWFVSAWSTQALKPPIS